jgi:hypothetical protein
MTFHELHDAAEPLLLPNAWDVPSALTFLDAGFAAIGTTSFGIASSLGRPDGGRATRDANLALARALSSLPAYVSVDIEDGYDDDPEQVAAYVAELAAAGAAGINIEDSSAEQLIAPEAHAAKVGAIKERCPGLFVNARVDTYWLGQDATPQATLARAARYVRAGADGVFVPGASEPAVLREICDTVPGAGEHAGDPRTVAERAGRVRRTPGEHRLSSVPGRHPRGGRGGRRRTRGARGACGGALRRAPGQARRPREVRRNRVRPGVPGAGRVLPVVGIASPMVR